MVGSEENDQGGRYKPEIPVTLHWMSILRPTRDTQCVLGSGPQKGMCEMGNFASDANRCFAHEVRPRRNAPAVRLTALPISCGVFISFRFLLGGAQRRLRHGCVRQLAQRIAWSLTRMTSASWRAHDCVSCIATHRPRASCPATDNSTWNIGGISGATVPATSSDMAAVCHCM